MSERKKSFWEYLEEVGVKVDLNPRFITLWEPDFKEVTNP